MSELSQHYPCIGIGQARASQQVWPEAAAAKERSLQVVRAFHAFFSRYYRHRSLATNPVTSEFGRAARSRVLLTSFFVHRRKLASAGCKIFFGWGGREGKGGMSHLAEGIPHTSDLSI